MFVGTCPYFMYMKGGALFCEGATIKYPDKKARADFLDCYCCNEDHGYKNCKMHGVLEGYYNRLYSGEKIEPIISVKNRATGKKGRCPRWEGGT